MKKSAITFFVLLCISPSVFAQGVDKFYKLDSMLTYLEKHNLFMGSVAIREKDDVVFAKAYGYADAEAGIKATPQTIYKIGSITKTFTAAMIFQLFEEGRLSDDTSLAKFYPMIKNADKITIGHLLAHETGIKDYVYDIDPTEPMTKEALLLKLAGYDSVFEPGTKARYSNSNYLLLGYIIADITGKTYNDNIKERILSKTNAASISSFDTIEIHKGEAASHYFGGTWEKYTPWHSSTVTAVGGLQSNAADLTTFIRDLFQGKFISREHVAEMKGTTSQGKGMYLTSYGDKFSHLNLLGHTGRIEGFSSLLCYDQDREVSFAILSNCDNQTGIDIDGAVLSCYYGLECKLPDFRSVAVNEDVLKKYAGTYGSDTPFKIDIREANGILTAQATGQEALPLCAVSDIEFNHYEAGINIVFDGKGGFLLKQGANSAHFVKE